MPLKTCNALRYAMTVGKLCKVLCVLSLCKSLSLCVCLSVCVGSCAVPGDVADPVCSDHRRSCALPAQTSRRQILLSHFSRDSRSRLDLLFAAAHDWQVSTPCHAPQHTLASQMGQGIKPNTVWKSPGISFLKLNGNPVLDPLLPSKCQ